MELSRWFHDMLVARKRNPDGREIVRWFWTPDWQRGERLAQRDLAHGQYQDFASINELLSVLRQDEQADQTTLRVAAALRKRLARER
jgi:hypothetical protein